jgi:16S rRNA G966 N2-methylase RsmD
MINNLFPLTDYSKLNYDIEGLYSITNPIEANEISSIIQSNFNDINNINIFDGTGGLGGNTINFSTHFKSVISCEINKDRYEMLLNNIQQYNLTNVTVLNIDSIKYIFEHYNNYDVYFFDPPWGGPLYKKKKHLKLLMGSYSLLDIASYLKKNTTNKLLIYKLPFNYDFNEFFEFDYKLYKINKYYIIILLI